jgi:hypothetical protein
VVLQACPITASLVDLLDTGDRDEDEEEENEFDFDGFVESDE